VPATFAQRKKIFRRCNRLLFKKLRERFDKPPGAPAGGAVVSTRDLDLRLCAKV